MTVTDLGIRRKGLAAVTFSPPPPADLYGAEYEGERLLIDREIIARCDLKKGAVFSEDDIKQLVFVNQCYRAKTRAVYYLSRRDYSEKGLYDKLCKDFIPKAAAFAVEQMKNKGFLNDERYALNLIQNLRGKNRSGRDILNKLCLKGVPRDLAVRLIGENQLALTDKERAKALITAKYLNKIRDEDDRRKTVQALLRRGFPFADIKTALKEVLSEDLLGEEIL